MPKVSPQQFCDYAREPVVGDGYAVLPETLLATEKMIASEDPAAAATLNKTLCQLLLREFSLANAVWILAAPFQALYRQQLIRIENNLAIKPDSYFSLGHDPFRKDLAILRHRLIPCGAELATPCSGLSRALLIKNGWRQGLDFVRVLLRCQGLSPFLELHMHPDFTASFNPPGWLQTYDRLADLVALNPALRGVQSTSWFLDPALLQVSPHLAYLRQVPERCGAIILYAGDADAQSCGALDTSATRRALNAAGHYKPRLFTRIWPRQALLQRRWQGSGG